MARRWTKGEEDAHRRELRQLYVVDNKSLRHIAPILGIQESTVYVRLKRLGIVTKRDGKLGFNKQRRDVFLPRKSRQLAEFLGIMLGDGHLTHFQVSVTLGTKEMVYARYVQELMRSLFGGVPKVITTKKGYAIVYLGSVATTSWLLDQGLVLNKVAAQVGVPAWIFNRKSYMTAFVRGFFDTDGSVYKLRFGIQLSLTNRSMPLLAALHRMMKILGYSPSSISGCRFYITRIPDIERFFQDIRPANSKHQKRFRDIMACLRRSDSGYSRRL